MLNINRCNHHGLYNLHKAFPSSKYTHILASNPLQAESTTVGQNNFLVEIHYKSAN